jgi:HEAT repeat protein
MGRMARSLPALVLLVVLAVATAATAQVESAIKALRKDPSLKVRTQAAIVLGQQGGTEAVPALREAVAEDRAAAVRLAAVGALQRLGARAARSTLQLAAQADPEESVRLAAARAVEALGPVTLQLEEPTGAPAAKKPLAEALARQLHDHGLAVAEAGELKLRPSARVDISEAGGRTSVDVQASLVVVDGDGRIDVLETRAKASVAGTVPEARRATYIQKAAEVAARGLVDDLAARLARK